MKKILITIASVLLVTAVVGVAYAQEVDEDGPVVTAPPDGPAAAGAVVAPVAAVQPEVNVAGAPPAPVVRFVFEGAAPTNVDINQFQGRDFHFSELPPEVLSLLRSADRPNFENIKPTDEREFRVLAPNGNQFKDSHPWDGIVQNVRNRSSNWSVSHERRGTGYEPRGMTVPKVYWVTYKFKY